MSVGAEVFLKGGYQKAFSCVQTLPRKDAWPCLEHMDHNARFEVADNDWVRKVSQQALCPDQVKVRNVDVLPCFLENGVTEGVLRSVDRLGRGNEELCADPREEFH